MTDPLSYLFGLEQFGIKFGLENMFAIAGRLGHPERAFRSVHVAGTNGKGSVTAMVDAALRAAGHRSARYTSPHLVDLTERFVIDGRPVDTETLVAAVADVRAAVEGLLHDGTLQAHPTFFEVTTAAAFEIFRRAHVDVAVFEVGLGGRLDATNVIAPILTAITSIAFDHEAHLGSTLAEIAAEKAGILTPRVPVIVGDLPAEALAVIERIADERGAELVRAAEGVTAVRAADGRSLRLRTPARDYGDVALGLRGGHQVANGVVAVRVLERLDDLGLRVPPSAVASGLARPSWPGRLDLRRLADGREILLDAAHNPAGSAALASYLDEHAERLPLVFAAMRDKDIDGMLQPLLPAVSRLVLTRASNRRSANPHALADRARRIAPAMSIAVCDSAAEALAVAWETSRRIVVAGSIFLLGDVLEQIGPS